MRKNRVYLYWVYLVILPSKGESKKKKKSRRSLVGKNIHTGTKQTESVVNKFPITSLKITSSLNMEESIIFVRPYTKRFAKITCALG